MHFQHAQIHTVNMTSFLLADGGSFKKHIIIDVVNNQVDLNFKLFWKWSAFKIAPRYCLKYTLISRSKTELTVYYGAEKGSEDFSPKVPSMRPECRKEP